MPTSQFLSMNFSYTANSKIIANSIKGILLAETWFVEYLGALVGKCFPLKIVKYAVGVY